MTLVTEQLKSPLFVAPALGAVVLEVTVTLALEVQALAISVTVTVYVPAVVTEGVALVLPLLHA